MSNFTFLTEEQCFGDDKLDILEKRGIQAAMTDFSILLGGCVSDQIGYYWTKSDDGDNDARMVSAQNQNTFGTRFAVNSRYGGARPALPFLKVSKIPTNGESGRRAKDGILEVEYGYYPQKAASKQCQEKLERAYQSGTISRTGNSYTTDSRKCNVHDEKFLAKQYEEYEFEGKRYVRVEANSGFGSRKFILSNGEEYKNGDYVWVEVSPVKWLVDEKSRMMLTEKIIFAGVQFNNERNYHTKDFDKTDIKIFMDKYLSKDLVQTRGTITIRRTNRRKPRNKTKKIEITKIKSR